jgi:hypothetical protein
VRDFVAFPDRKSALGSEKISSFQEPSMNHVHVRPFSSLSTAAEAEVIEEEKR